MHVITRVHVCIYIYIMSTDRQSFAQVIAEEYAQFLSCMHADTLILDKVLTWVFGQKAPPLVEHRSKPWDRLRPRDPPAAAPLGSRTCPVAQCQIQETGEICAPVKPWRGKKIQNPEVKMCSCVFLYKFMGAPSTCLLVGCPSAVAWLFWLRPHLSVWWYCSLAAHSSASAQ